jgi:hypothetical protein
MLSAVGVPQPPRPWFASGDRFLIAGRFLCPHRRLKKGIIPTNQIASISLCANPQHHIVHRSSSLGSIQRIYPIRKRLRGTWETNGKIGAGHGLSRRKRVVQTAPPNEIINPVEPLFCLARLPEAERPYIYALNETLRLSVMWAGRPWRLSGFSLVRSCIRSQSKFVLNGLKDPA